MADEVKKDRRGTFWDWPVGVMIAAVLLALFTHPTPLSIGLFWFGVLSLMIRRGAFSSRRD